jgi:hypothetical protein
MFVIHNQTYLRGSRLGARSVLRPIMDNSKRALRTAERPGLQASGHASTDCRQLWWKRSGHASRDRATAHARASCSMALWAHDLGDEGRVVLGKSGTATHIPS